MKQPAKGQVLLLAGAVTLMAVAGALRISQQVAAHRTTTNSVAALSARGFTLQHAPPRFQIPLLRNAGPVTDAFAPGSGTTDHDLKTLADLHSVKQLGLSETSITDEGLRHLTTLSELEHLNLNHTNISDDGLAELSRLPNLQSICLCGTTVSDNGLKYLAAMPKLESAQLGRDKITDTGIDAFRPLCKRFIKIHR